MCYSTKKKIADCVRQLMKRKEISKITIGDIMEATGMSRQSFYYHLRIFMMCWSGSAVMTLRISCRDSMTVWKSGHAI